MTQKKNICECIDRNFIGKSTELRKILAKQNTKKSKSRPLEVNEEEKKYKQKHYNSSFTKGLSHDKNGHLDDNKHYEQYVKSIINNDQNLFSQIKMSKESGFKFVEPFAGLCAPLMGYDKSSIKIKKPPTIHDKGGASEMFELYSKVLARDVPFNLYDGDNIINNIISNIKKNDIVKYLPYFPYHQAFHDNIFRGPFKGDKLGPYISQLLYLNVPMGALTLEQKYEVYPNKQTALNMGINIEWGRNNLEVIKLQNANIKEQPPIIERSKLEKKYIYNGRSLAEAVHSDPLYQFYYHASLILNGLGASANPTLPKLINEQTFISGGPSVQTMISEVCGLALEHTWYWKWLVFRKLRPEAFGLWIDNIKNNRTSNNEYNIDHLILDNILLEQIKNDNKKWGFESSYTLSMTYREGSPLHPAYPSGHAAISGACCTILKIFFDGDQLWSSLPGLNGNINRRIVPNYIKGPIVESARDGNKLQDYQGNDINSITAADEINKLACNIAIGRNWAGIHYRSDAIGGILLGEKVAIGYVKDKMSTWVQNNGGETIPEIKFKKFNGKIKTLRPKICE